MEKKLWRFTDNQGSFESRLAHQIKTLYFPLANEKIMSSVTPDLHGDIKTGQDSFLLTPVSRSDLKDSKSSRNFWIYPVRKYTSSDMSFSNGAYINQNKIWSATGVSKNLKQIKEDRVCLQAGLLWHQVTRENKKIGLSAEILSFVPVTGEPVEIMQVKITNTSAHNIEFIPSAAIPIYARSANNLRDHRHVTSLLQRVRLHKLGVMVEPTLVFDEFGHRPNKDIYFVLGWNQRARPPQYIYPTQEAFCGESGDLEAPLAVLENMPPDKNAQIQGRDAMAALRFHKIVLSPRQSRSYIVLMGITESKTEIEKIINRFKGRGKVKESFSQTKKFWVDQSNQISLSSGNADFDNWFRWVSIQPILRRIFGCSFLPDFDYGKGGRGWRDLWQDCLSLILSDPQKVRPLLINNFSGVRIDGSNATIIGKKPGEFISDRNNISRVWMDHGIWPLLTLDLYINETGDKDILLKEASYFRDHHILRSSAIDYKWQPADGGRLKTNSGKIYQGSILEHLLLENLVQFFNVGSHNYVRLEGADWNDGLDMAGENGESVAFSCMYAHNLQILAQWLHEINCPRIKIARELKILLKSINYRDIKAKHTLLRDYFHRTKHCLSGKKIDIDSAALVDDLRQKSAWMMAHISKDAWLRPGFFNGYYDNRKKRVEGASNNLVRMLLASQVFPIMSGAAEDWQIKLMWKAIHQHLFDRKFKGYHINTDFKEEQHNLGRAFSFVYGDKENGAFFNHMIVMLAYGLYKRGFIDEGWQVLKSISDMAMDTAVSKIYPCLPEYFNLEARGMYSYLTGSASWFVLTLLTEVFGVKGRDGDLCIEPKIHPQQFSDSQEVSVQRTFAGKKFQIKFSHPKGTPRKDYKIIKARLNDQDLALEASALLIKRQELFRLPSDRVNRLEIVLG